MIRFTPTVLTGAVTLLLTAQITSAQNMPIQLDPIVVTASRSAENVSHTPARVTVIDEQTIAQNPTQNLSDLLQKNAGIYIKQSGGIGQLTTLSLRGGYTGSTLLLQDGARLNTPDLAAQYPEFLDLSNAQSIEIVKGPASVQYGSDAISGVVQIITKKPTKNSAFFTNEIGSNHTWKGIVGGDIVLDNGLYAQVQGQRLESDGTSILDNQAETEKASYDQKGYTAKIGFDNDILDTNVYISQNKGTNVYSGNTWNLDLPNYNKNNAHRNFENRLVNWNTKYKINNDLVLNAHYSHFDNQRSNIQSDHNNINYFNSKINEGDLNLKWDFTNNQNILIGATVNKTNYMSNSIENGSQKIHSNGYYLQHQYHSDEINTQVGVRLEDHSKYGNHVVGQGSVRYHFSPDLSIYTNIGSAFKAPSADQLFASLWAIGNPNLKPEESFSYELGLDYQLHDNFHSYISVYQTQFKNLIKYIPMGNPNYINVNKTKATGGELGLKWQNDDYFISSEYAYVKAEDDKGVEIPYRPRQTLTFSTGLANEVYGLSASLIARSHAKDKAIKVPGYATVDLNGYWNTSEHVKLFLNVNNIADVRYKEVYNSSPIFWYINGGRFISAGATFRY